MSCWYRNSCPSVELGCEKDCIRYIEMKFLLENSGLPRAQQGPVTIRPSKADHEFYRILQEISDDIVSFVEQGENLIIWSKNTGNGKSTWARKLLTRYFHEVAVGNALRVRGQFVAFTDFRLRCHDFSDPELGAYLKMLETVDLVVWDDIADTVLKDYQYSVFIRILDKRLSSGKSNIYTTNLVGEQLQQNIGRRLYSRIVNPSTQISFRDEDKRGIL